MVKAWAFRPPAPRSLLFAAGLLPSGLGLTWLAFMALPDGTAGITAAVVGLCAVGMVAAERLIVPRVMRRRQGSVLVLGREDLAATLCSDLAKWRHAGPSDRLGSSMPMTIDPVELRKLVEAQSIRRIIIAEPNPEARREMTPALLECRLLGIEVEDGVELYQRIHGKLWLEALDPVRFVFSRGFRMTPSYLRLKRVLDVTCAVLLLVVGAPLMLAIALAVKLESKGPVLFRQERVGQFGRNFMLYKFRSMRQDAEKETGPTWARKDDDRVTRIGGFLRKSHLDELPQVFNALRGDVSFVGPRPERPCFVATLRQQIPYYDLRLYMKPGITGWAQVCYRYCDTVEDSYQKLQYDLAYARDVSLLLDLRILARTALVMLGRKGQ